MSVIEDFVGRSTDTKQAVLLHIRDVIAGRFPEAVETISYGMPVMKLRGKYLMGFAVFTRHYSLFPGSVPIEHLAGELAGYDTAKGTIRFTAEHPLSDELIVRIVERCAVDIP